MAAAVTVSRVDSLGRPRGAGRVPFLMFAAVLGLVTVVLVVGLSRIDWVLVLLIPVLLLTGYFLAGVMRVLIGSRPDAPGGRENGGVNEEE